jgi:DNA-binding SARP family transcriptional activator
MGGRRGAVAGETVAAALAADGRLDRCAWLRVEPALRDQALLGHALVQAVGRRHPGAARAVAQRLAGGVPALDALVAAVAQAPDGPSVVVLEDSGRGRPPHILGAAAAAWARCSEPAPPLVVLVHGRLHRSLRPWAVALPALVASPAQSSTPDASPLSASALRRLNRLSDGRGTVVADVVAAAAAWRGSDLGGVIARAHTLGGLLGRVSEHLVAGASPQVLAALTAATRLGAWHRGFLAASDASECEGADDPSEWLHPWLVPLEDGWHAVRPVWWRPLAGALERAIGQRRRRNRSVLRPAQPGSEDGRVTMTRALGPRRVDGRHEGCGDGPGPRGRVVRVRLLGNFELTVDGRPATDWHGQLGPALVKYLLAQPKRACARDVLLEQFWPGVHPDVARKRLHVALSSVRRALAAVTDATLVEFRDGFYRIAAVHGVDTDVDRFHALAEAGRGAEIDGRLDDAAALYQRAAATYTGDFLADCPYDDWTMLPREELRMAYVDLLDRWSGVLAAAGREPECVEVCRLVLRKDSCREDVHRLIMRCQARVGRTSDALRQYELCRRALRDTLGVEPSAPTQALARSLRDRVQPRATTQLSYAR